MVRRLIISNSQADFTSHAGLGLVGMALERCTNLAVEAKAVAAVRTDAMPHQTMLASYVGLLCLGKSDFDAIDAFRTDPFFLHALGLAQAPSAASLRQRLDAHADAFKNVVIAATIEFLCRRGARITPLANGLVPLDADVTPFDNGKTKKEGVSRTYKGRDGFAPMAAYLGQEGWCLEFELREGCQHWQKGTPEFLARARRLTDAPLRRHLDSGHDAIENIATLAAFEEQHPDTAPVHYNIKWNPRREDPEAWLAYAEEHGDWSTPPPRAIASEN